MEGGKKALVVIVILALVVAIAVWVMRSGSSEKGSEDARDIFNRKPMELVCEETLEVITKPRGEWIELGCSEENKYKNPKTGNYTMMTPMKCESCGEKIPLVVIEAPEGLDDEATIRYIENKERELICPRCKKPVYSVY